MKQRKFVLIGWVLFLCLAVSCTGKNRHYQEKEVNGYLERIYQEKFEYLSTEEKPDENEVIFNFLATDRNQLPIQVTSQQGSGSIFGCLGTGCAYYLTDNYEAVAYDDKAKQIVKAKNDPRLIYSVNDPIYGDILYVTYHDFQSIESSYLLAIEVFQELSESMPLGSSVRVDMKSDDLAMRNVAPTSYVRKADSGSDCLQLQLDYVDYLVEYGLEDQSVNDQMLKRSREQVTGLHVSDGSNYEVYSDLPNQSNKSFATLYEVAQRWGLLVTGTSDNFEVKTEKSTYHFSYDFYSYLENGEQVTYYLVDGQKQEVNDYTVWQQDLFNLQITPAQNAIRAFYQNEELNKVQFKKQADFYIVETPYHDASEIIEQVIQKVDFLQSINPVDCKSETTCSLEEKADYKAIRQLEEVVEQDDVLSGNLYLNQGQPFAVSLDYYDDQGYYYYTDQGKQRLPNSQALLSCDNFLILFNLECHIDEINNCIMLQEVIQ